MLIHTELAVYAGSFNPFHIGHKNILDTAEAIFGLGNVVIAIGSNPDKKNNIDLLQEINATELSKKLAPRRVDSYSGFLHDYITLIETEYNTTNVVLIRGLRNGDDLNYETNQFRFMQDFKPNLKAVFIPCDPQFEYISSTAIRNIQKLDPEKAKKYLI